MLACVLLLALPNIAFAALSGTATFAANPAQYVDGDSVELKCSLTGATSFAITKGGTAVTGFTADTAATTPETVKTITYSSADAGTYTCTPSDDTGAATAVTLDLVGHVIKPTLTITTPANGAAYTDGTEVTITCSTTTSGVTYSFKKGTAAHTSGVTAGALTFSSYSAATDAGSYTCTATKDSKSLESDALTVGNSAAQMMTSVVLLPLCLLVASIIY